MRKGFLKLYIRLLRFRLQRYLKRPHQGAAKWVARGISWSYQFVTLLKLALREFVRDDAFRHGAALSYYTIFSLPPILIILISGLGFFLGEEDVQQKLMKQIGELFGAQGQRQLAYVIEHFHNNQNSSISATVGLITLFFTSTALFYTLQSSLNTFWKVPYHLQKKGLIAVIKDRLLAFAMVVSLGAFQLISIFAQFVLAGVERIVASYLPDFLSITNLFLYINMGVSLAITVVLFAVIFKYLPAAAVSWRDVWVGSLFTMVLFLIGKQFIGWYIQNMQPGLTYGAAGSLIVILLWVFYSSQILFLGAEFTYVYSKRHGKDIVPNELLRRQKKQEQLAETETP